MCIVIYIPEHFQKFSFSNYWNPHNKALTEFSYVTNRSKHYELFKKF